MPYREQIAEAERKRQQQAVATQNAKPVMTPAQAVRNLNSPQQSVRGSAARSPLLNTPAPPTFGGGGGGRQEEAPARTPQYGDFAQNWRDAEYNSQIASLNRALQDFETGAQQRGERYGIDYLQGVRNIGYRPAPGFVAMPNILEAAEQQTSPTAARAIMGSEQPDPTANLQGQWDLEGQFNPYSAAARGTRGTRDEFAGRGTLRSSDFAKTFGDFQNRLNEQLGAMETGRTRFAEDLSGDVARQRTETEERRQAAERAAINRAATAQMNAYMRSLAGG